MKSVIINGKFLSANMTGVHRVAEALILQLNELNGSENITHETEIFMPRSARRKFENVKFQQKVVGNLIGPMWEQFDLPRFARKSLLVNFCNLAPLASKNAITMIHDAQVYLTPKSYSWPFKIWYKFALPTIGKRHKKLLTVSEYSKQQLIKFGIAPAGKIEVVHNGVDHILDIESEHKILEHLNIVDETYLCALSNTQKHKNISLLFDVMKHPSMKDIKLVLIGGASRKDFEAQGETVPNNVIFSGRISDGEMRGLIENALCYLFPSLTEGFGLPPLESMLLGTPAIVAPKGALPEVCGDAVLYADPNDSNHWAITIEKLNKRPDYRAKLSQKGIQQAKKFTWEKAGQEVFSIIKSLLADDN